MKTSMRGELTSQSQSDHAYELTNSDMVQAVANYLKASDSEDISQLNSCVTPILVNSVASTVSDAKLSSHSTNHFF